MKPSNLKQAFVKAFTFALLSLSTFNANAGGDIYEIYLNNKLILKQFVILPLNIKSLQLDKANSNDQLVIFYSHCGQTGKERSIAIKDDKGKIVKQWKFANATSSNKSMIIPVKELLQLGENNTKTHLHLYYAARELPKGRILTSVDLVKSNVTFNQPKAKAGSTMTAILIGAFYLWWLR